MKTLLLSLLAIFALLLLGCETNRGPDTRQDLVGFFLGLEGHDQTEYEEYDYEDYVESKKRVESLKGL